jgi:hypothetical protein
LLSKGIRRQIKRRIVKKEISLGEKKEIVRSYIFRLKAEVAFQISGITNINIIIKRRKPNKVEFVLSIHFTPIVMDKSGSFQ